MLGTQKGRGRHAFLVHAKSPVIQEAVAAALGGGGGGLSR
jgi:hypothetical protein